MKSSSESKISASKAQPPGFIKAKIFILDDHPVFRQGLVEMIKEEPDMRVCGQAKTAAEALKAIPRLKPDLALVDISLPDKSGLEVLKEVRAANRKIKLLVVSMHDEALYASRVLQHGGDGYIMKREDPSEIIEAIRDVLNGHLYLSEEVMASMGQEKRKAPSRSKKEESALDRLTDAELEVLELLGQGLSNEEIAKQLHLDLKKVTAQCGAIKKKLKLKTDNALVHYAVCWVETGVTQPG